MKTYVYTKANKKTVSLVNFVHVPRTAGTAFTSCLFDSSNHKRNTRQNILLNTFFIFLLDLGVIGAALGTVISYWIMLSASLIDIKYFKMQILWKKHIKWFLWIFLFNCPLLVISNFKLVNYDLNFLNIIIYVFLITLLNFFSVISYFGEEKSLFIKTIDKFFSKNDY